MTNRNKTFDACLLRVSENEYVVAEWDQLITVADKKRLSINSSVGFKRSKSKREKAIRGTIVLIGEIRSAGMKSCLFFSLRFSEIMSTSTRLDYLED
jgi:hypothetical protein